jgi:hypothetical protein
MLKLTITNVDKSTADIITYIAKKSGGKVTNAKEVKFKDDDLADENILELRNHMNNLIEQVEKNFYDKNGKSVKSKV